MVSSTHAGRSTGSRAVARAVAGGLMTALVACGGSTTPGTASGSTLDAGLPPGRACTEIGCENGVRIDFSYRERGAYVFEVDIDGARTTCKAALPLPRTPPTACDSDGVFLGLVGSMLPEADQSIGGLTISSTSAKSIAVRGTRDGSPLGEKTFAVSYTTTPGPNGPGCEPAECKLARATFP